MILVICRMVSQESPGGRGKLSWAIWERLEGRCARLEGIDGIPMG